MKTFWGIISLPNTCLHGGDSNPQVNIQLGAGPGLNIFNDNLIAFEIIR